MSQFIKNSEELHHLLVRYWTAQQNNAESETRRTQFARIAVPAEVPRGPTVRLQLIVHDVAENATDGVRVYGKLAGEDERSLLEEIFKSRVWAGRGIVASFGTKTTLAQATFDRLAALCASDVISISGFLGRDGRLDRVGRLNNEGVSMRFGERDIYSADFWWLMADCQFL